MQLTTKLAHHYPRVLHTLGRPLRLGDRMFKLQGYHADRLARDVSDEPHSVEVIRRIFAEREGAFLDVGANCGQTLVKVLGIDAERPYFGFEPQLSCCFYIDQFLRLNALHSAQIIPVALSNANGMCELFREGEGSLTASVVPNEAAGGNAQPLQSSWVPARRGDEIVAELGIGPIAAIKIDVEGFELDVLQGLAMTIAERRPVIMFEVLRNFVWGEPIADPAAGRERQAKADAIYALLRGLGYAIFAVDRFGNEQRIDGFTLGERPDAARMNDGRDYVARG